MDNKLAQVQDIFLTNINQICGKLGLNNIMAQLYVALYFSDKALSLDDMVEQLKISKASASINIRALERYGAVRKIWVKGSRKDFYAPEGDITKVIMERVRSMVKGRLSEVESMLNLSYEALNSVEAGHGADDESVKLFKDRLNKLRSLYERSNGFFQLFNTGLVAMMAEDKHEDAKDGLFHLTASSHPAQ